MPTVTRPTAPPQGRTARLRRGQPDRSRALACATILLATVLGGCVTENTATGENIPRGKQRYEFSKVEEAAEHLQDGMTKLQVLLLLGSAAEMDESGDVWIYLPERYAILIPARALQLEFKNDVLVSHGYRAIVLGTKL